MATCIACHAGHTHTSTRGYQRKAEATVAKTARSHLLLKPTTASPFLVLFKQLPPLMEIQNSGVDRASPELVAESPVYSSVLLEKFRSPGCSGGAGERAHSTLQCLRSHMGKRPSQRLRRGSRSCTPGMR